MISARDAETESETRVVCNRREPDRQEWGGAGTKTHHADPCPCHPVSPFVGNGSYSKLLFLARCSRTFRNGSDVRSGNGRAWLAGEFSSSCSWGLVCPS